MISKQLPLEPMTLHKQQDIALSHLFFVSRTIGVSLLEFFYSNIRKYIKYNWYLLH